MAVTTDAITAEDLAYRAANKPVAVGNNALETAYASGVLRASVGGLVASADASDATYGVEFLQDRFIHVPWKFGSSETDVYIVIDTGSVDGSGLVDALWIKGGVSMAGRTITVECLDTTPAVPWVGATTVFTFVMPAGGDTLQLHATTLHAARYWRILVSGAAGTFQADEIVLGTAVQFPVKSRYEWVPPQAKVGGVNEVLSEKGGVRKATRTAPSLQERQQKFQIGDTPTGTFLTAFAAFWEDSDQLNGGSNPFVYCEDPTSAPNDALLVYSNETKLDLVQVGPYETILTLDFTEQGGGD